MQRQKENWFRAIQGAVRTSGSSNRYAGHTWSVVPPRRLVSLDGSTLQVQDSSANEQAFGRPQTAKTTRPAAYPLIRFVMLIENGTRAPLAAAMDRYSTSEVALARQMIGCLGKNMLCLADRLFYSYDMWLHAVA